MTLISPKCFGHPQRLFGFNSQTLRRHLLCSALSKTQKKQPCTSRVTAAALHGLKIGMLTNGMQRIDIGISYTAHLRHPTRQDRLVPDRAEAIRILANTSSTGTWKPYSVGGMANGPRAVRTVVPRPRGSDGPCPTTAPRATSPPVFCTGRTCRFRGAYTSIKAEPSTFEVMLNEENESVLAS